MSAETIAVLAIMIGGYPLLVLLIAVTGPHNETEKRELRAYRAEQRRATLAQQEQKNVR